MTPEGLPETIDELFDYILQYADTIYVRHQVNSKWSNVALSKLPARDALAHIFDWIKRGHIPVRVKREGADA
jgi:hypothetical protein